MFRKALLATCALVLTLGLVGTTGCTSLNQGLRDGVSDGVGAALAALIETPINFALDQLLAANDG